MYVPPFCHHHHHHHIHFRALFFSTEGWAFLTSLSPRRPLHSEWFWGSAESIPSFFLSFSSTSSHDFLGLPDLFCATTFSLCTSAIQPVPRSVCCFISDALHVWLWHSFASKLYSSDGFDSRSCQSEQWVCSPIHFSPHPIFCLFLRYKKV